MALFWTCKILILLRCRKRNRVASGGASTSKKPRAVESEDVKALKKLFKQSTPDAITKTISDSFKTASPENIQALREILSPLFQASSTPLHCVRCHKKYLESGNHKNACVVECDEDADFTRDYHNGSEGYYTKSCCGGTFREGEEDDEDGICFTTWHTTNPKEVEYHEGEEEDEEEGLNLEGSRRVVTCRVNGCKK